MVFIITDYLSTFRTWDPSVQIGPEFLRIPQSKVCVHRARHLLKRAVGGLLGDQSTALCPVQPASCTSRLGGVQLRDCGGHAASTWLRGPLPPPTQGPCHIGSLTPTNLPLPRLPFSCPLSSKPGPYDFAATSVEAEVSKAQSNILSICHLVRKLGLRPPATSSKLSCLDTDNLWPGSGIQETKAHPW